MSSLVTPEFEFPVVVTPVPLPNPQNSNASSVTESLGRVTLADRFATVPLDVLMQRSRHMADLFSGYFSTFANTSCTVTHAFASPMQLPLLPVVPARRTPFGHLNFLASPIEGLYFDPDDVTGS
jgi:hypothetical protein